jgi:hypothetical protein
MASPFRQHLLFEAAGLVAASGVLAVVGAARAMVTRRKNTSSGDLVASVPLSVDVFNLATLGMALLAFLGFYFDSQASISRVTAPFVLLSMLVLVTTRCRLWIVGALVAANVFVASPFIAQYREWRSAMFGLEDRQAINTLREQMHALIEYQPGEDPWCNTLLTTVYPPAILTVPAGIGLSMGTRKTPSAEPVKSRYLLLGDTAALELYGGDIALRHLAKTALGDLYLNLRAPCRTPAG